MDRDYTVFISHAGPDKLTVAIPIRKRLAALNILSFLDKLSLHPGDNGPAVMDYAMATAPIGVFILSPEFPARNWTMRELLTFQHREQDAIVSGTAPPKIIPVFYRLNLRECRDRDLFRLVDDAGQSVFMENAFFDRVLDEKITMRQVFDAMNLVTRRTGVENFDEATNDDSAEMSALREKLIDRIVEAIVSAVETVRNEGGEDKAVTFWRHSLNASVSAKAPQASSSASSTSASTGSFVRHFEFWPNPSYIHLNLQADTDTPSSPALAKRHLLQRSPHATVLVLQGMPGVGKTTAMRALCHDMDLRSRYSHGVHLISLGAQATPQNVIDALCIALKSAGGAAMVAKLGPHLSLKATVTAVASWFARRVVLWLVDDMWHTDAGAFGGELIDALARVVAAGADAALVVSTREKGLLMHRSVTHRVRLLSHLPQDSFARGILLRAAFGDPAVILSPASEQLLHDLLSSCAGLPIVLSAIGRSVGRVALDVDEDPDRALRAYCSIRTDESLTVSALDQDVDGYTSLSFALSTSFAILRTRNHSPKAGAQVQLRHSYEEMHRALCILQKQQWVPLTILNRVWGLQSGRDASIVVDRFADVCLLDVQYRTCGDVEVKGARLHDLVHDYATRNAKAAGEMQSWHSSLLESFCLSNASVEHCHPSDLAGKRPSRRCSARDEICRPWWSVSSTVDNYVDENIVRHLLGSGCFREASVLVSRPQWIVRHLQTCGILLTERNFEMLDTLLSTAESTLSNQDLKHGLVLLLNAIRMSVVAVLDNPHEICFQLCARLIDSKKISNYVYNVVDYAESQSAKPFLRPITSCLRTAGSLTGKLIQCPKVKCVHVFKSSSLVAAGTEDGSVMVFNLNTGEKTKELSAHKGSVRQIVSTGDGLIVSRSTDHTCKIFDGKRDYIEIAECNLPGEIWCIEVTPDGYHLLAACGYLVSMWDPYSGRCVNRIVALHRSWISSVAVSPDGKIVASGAIGGEIRLWKNSTEEVDVKRELAAEKPDGEGSGRVSGVPRERYNYVGGASEPDPKPADNQKFGGLNMRRLELTVNRFCFTPDSRRLLSAASESITLWNVDAATLSIQLVTSFKGPLSILFLSVASHGDGLEVISGGRDGKARFSALDGTPKRAVEFADEGEEIEALAMANGSERLIWCESDGIRTADMSQLSARRSAAFKHTGTVMALRMAPDGDRVVTCGMDAKLMVWDVETGMQIGSALEGHERFVDARCLRITPNGKRIVSAARHIILVWDLDKLQQIARFDEHRHAIQDIKISCDGRFLVSGGKDETLRIWDLTSCDGSHSVREEHRSTIRQILLAQNGAQFLSLSDTEGILWDFEPLRAVMGIEGQMYFGDVQVLEGVFNTALVSDDDKCTVDDASRLVRSDDWKYLKMSRDEKESVLATLDTKAWRLAYSRKRRTLVVGLGSGHVCMMKVEMDNGGTSSEEQAT